MGKCSVLTVIGHKIFVQLVSLVFENLAQVNSNFASNLLHKSVQFAKIVGQTYQLIERTDL